MDNYRSCDNHDRKVNRISPDIATFKYADKPYFHVTVNNYYFTLSLETFQYATDFVNSANTKNTLLRE